VTIERATVDVIEKPRLGVVIYHRRTAGITMVTRLLSSLKFFDIGPSRFKSHPRTTFYNIPCTRREGRFGSG